MSDIPRWYYRIDKFTRLYGVMKDLYSTGSDAHSIMDAEKDTFVSYYEFLRDCLKTREIYAYFPVDIFKKAHEFSLIEDLDLWLGFIHDLNILNFEPDNEKRSEIHKYFVKTYINAFDKAYADIIDLKGRCNFPSEPEDGVYPDELTEHTNQDMLIPDKVYGVMQTTFKQLKDVKRVWLFGSRIKGGATVRSDIDLIIDSPLDTFDDVLFVINKMRVPNLVDAHNMYEENHQDFINRVANIKPWLIYKKIS